MDRYFLTADPDSTFVRNNLILLFPLLFSCFLHWLEKLCLFVPAGDGEILLHTRMSIWSVPLIVIVTAATNISSSSEQERKRFWFPVKTKWLFSVPCEQQSKIEFIFCWRFTDSLHHFFPLRKLWKQSVQLRWACFYFLKNVNARRYKIIFILRWPDSQL